MLNLCLSAWQFLNNIIICNVLLHGTLVTLGDLSWFLLSCLGPLVLLLPKTLNCLAFQSFDINERIWWSLFQESSVVRTKFNILLYVFITMLMSQYNHGKIICVCFVDRCLSFCPFFFLAIVLSVLLRFTDSDYPFGIFKLFL